MRTPLLISLSILVYYLHWQEPISNGSVSQPFHHSVQFNTLPEPSHSKVHIFPQFVCDRQSDSLELVNFYNATGGSNWTVRWDFSKPMNTWSGLQFNGEGCVIKVSLQQNNLTGVLPDLNLPFLNTLELPINKISGFLPPFSYIKNVTTINLRGNDFYGSVPKMDALTELVVLDLQQNRLSGTLPILSNNKKIKELQVAHNDLKGFFPDNSVLHPLINLNTINDNRLTFEHLIQNVQKVKYQIEVINGHLNTFIYAPQQKIYPDTTITIPDNTNYTLDLMIDDTVTTSTYTWYKNGVLYKTIKGSNKLSFNPFTPTDAGRYTVKITNPLAPQLTLESGRIQLVDCLRPAFISNVNFTTTCQGTFLFLPTISNIKTGHAMYFTLPGRKGIAYQERTSYEHSFISDSLVIYANDFNTCDSAGTTIEKVFKVYKIISPLIDSSFTRTETTCGYYVLPKITGTNLSGREIYYTQDSSRYKAGDTIRKSDTYIVQAISQDGRCFDIKYLTVIILPSPKIEKLNDQSIPCGEQYTFPLISGTNISALNGYFSGSHGTGQKFMPGDKVSIQGNQKYYIYASNGSCTDEDTFNVSIQNQPNYRLNPDQYKVQYQNTTFFGVLENDNLPAGTAVKVTIDTTQNGTMLYIPATGKGSYTPGKGFSGKEILKYTVCPVSCPDACSTTTLEFDVEPPCNGSTSLVLPKMIFPEGSSDNKRYFIVEALNRCQEALGQNPTKIMVYNRLGDLVYLSKDYKNDWDGTDTQGQPLLAATYNYSLDLGGVSAPVKGYLVIMR